MNDIKTILFMHWSRYPEMRIQDMVKLIYQNEFAGEHFVLDEAESLRRLTEEYLSLRPASGGEAFEDIGNGLCRLHLASDVCGKMQLMTINRFFINTANTHKGTLEGFTRKLDVLRRCCVDGELPYPAEEVDAFIKSYMAQRYPPVRHSDAYRASYRPAYRVVGSAYRDFADVFCRIDALMKTKERVYVAIDGNSAAGKSTLAALIGEVYKGNVFHMDDFFLTPDLRTPERFSETGGNVDYMRFREKVIGGLRSGEAFSYQAYDCKAQAMGKPVHVQPARVNIIEGAYSLHPTLIDLYDLKIFLSVDAEEQSRRIWERNGAAMHRRFMEEWIPMENRYFEEMGIKEKCDLIYGVKGYGDTQGEGR